tara:strand:+ start:86 stop:625 length:540 start_codon:yes stop_codon:yes gene_type:complete
MAILKKIRSGVDKVRKKYIPTFGEQFDKAKKEGKKTFKSTRDDKKKGKLEYSTMTKKEVDKKRGRLKRDYERNTGGKGGGADSGKKPVYEKATGTEVSSRGKAFAKARKEGKKTFMYNGKKYTTMLKGEKKKKLLQMPELSGKTSKKIKKVVRGDDFRNVSARKGGLIRGIPKLATKGY